MKPWNQTPDSRAREVAKALAFFGCLSAGVACVSLGIAGRRMLRAATQGGRVPADACLAPGMRDPLFASRTYLASALRRLQDPAPDTQEVIAAINASLQCLKRLEAPAAERAE